MNKTRLWIAIISLAVAALACNVLGSAAPTATPKPREKVIPPAATATPRPNYNTEFPLPDDVSNFIEFGGGIVNFETKMSLEESMVFYRDSFGKQGYTERELLTVTSDTTFSMVFDGHKSGKAILIQGVDTGDSSTNVSIHLGETD